MDKVVDCICLIFRTYAFDLKGRFLHQFRWEEKGYQTVIDVKVAKTRIVYELFAVGL